MHSDHLGAWRALLLCRADGRQPEGGRGEEASLTPPQAWASLPQPCTEGRNFTSILEVGKRRPREVTD